MKKKEIINILIIVACVLVVAGLGSLFVNIGMNWFNSLTKPNEWIPNYIIPIVWSVIYLAFAIVLSIWINKQKLSIETLVYLIINGALNIIWCLVFFTFNQLFLGNIIIILNLIAGFVLLCDILKQNRTYGYILAIYPVWLSIATTLNLALLILN